MNNKISFKTALAIFLLAIFITTWATGCANYGNSPQKPLPPPQVDNQKQAHTNPALALAQRVKAEATTVPGVENSTAVVLDKNISLAIKVRGFDRLRLNQIREKVHEQVADLAPTYEVHVTSDKKLFFELQKIEQHLQRENKITNSNLKTKVDKINEQMRG